MFLHVPRAAGTSIISTLRNVCPMTSYAGKAWDAVEYGVRKEDGAPYYAKDHSVGIPGFCKLYPVVACARNPYARELSYYLWNRRHPASNHPVHIAASAFSFSRYMEFRLKYRQYDSFATRLFGTQSDFLRDVSYTMILPFEQINEAFTLFCETVGITPVPLGLSRDTDSAPYDPLELYTLRAKRLVQEWAADDFTTFGYDPNLLPW